MGREALQFLRKPSRVISHLHKLGALSLSLIK